MPIPRKPRARRTPLTSDSIERAALALIDEQGLEAFSTRKLGERLGCEAMSIYHHFPSKAHLLDALVDRVVRENPLPPAELAPMERMREFARGWRAMALRHPGFYPVLSVHRMNSATGVAYLDQILSTLRSGGLERERAARLFRIIGYYIMGAALDEISGYGRGPSSLNPISDAELAARFPAIAEAGRFFKPGNFEKTFELGLDLLLEQSGLTARPRRRRVVRNPRGP